MDPNTLRRRPGEGPVLHQDRVRLATRRVGDDDDDCFELRVIVYLLYARGRSLETIAEALDMTVEDCHELRRKALRCL